MARTKTQEQLRTQWKRVNKYIRQRWGKEGFMAYFGQLCKCSLNMGEYNGEHPYYIGGRKNETYYNERNNAPVPFEIYAK